MKLESKSINTGNQLFPYIVGTEQYRAIEESAQHISPLYGPVHKVTSYLGIDNQFHALAGHVEMTDINHVLSRIVPDPSLDTGTSSTLASGGKGYSMSDMFLSSLGEAVERGTASLRAFANRDKFILDSSKNLLAKGINHLTPAQLPLFAPEQTDMYSPEGLHVPFTEDTVVAWRPGKSLISDATIHVPAQLVSLLHIFSPEESIIGYSQSGGLSCHVSYDDAIYHGITELIERDASGLRWYAGIPPVKVELDSGFETNPECARLVADLQSYPVATELYLHNIDLNEVPAFTAIRIEPHLNEFSYLAGGGADMCPLSSLRKTLSEFGQSERMLKQAVLSPQRSLNQSLNEMFNVRPDARPEEFDLFFKVIGYYGNVRNRSKLDWYLNGTETIKFSEICERTHQSVLNASPKEKLPKLLDLLRKLNLDVILFDLTPPEWGSLRLTKVFMPQLMSPFLPSRPIYGHPRLRNARQTLGISDKPLSYSEITPDPLPYP